MTEFGQTFTNGTSQAFAHVDFGDPHVAVIITFHFAQPLQVALIEVQDHTLSNHGHTIFSAFGDALEHGSHDGVHQLVQTERTLIELFGNQRQGGPGRFANTQGQVTGTSAHGNGDVPTAGGAGIGHQTLDDFHTVVASGLVAKGADLWREIEVVVDGFGNVRYPDASPGGLLHVHRAEGRVVPTNGDQFVDALGFQGVNDPLQILGILGGVGPAGPEHGTTAEVQATDISNVHGFQGVEIPLHDSGEAVTNAVHLRPRQAGPNHCRSNDTIDTRGRTTTNNNRKSSGHRKPPFKIGATVYRGCGAGPKPRKQNVQSSDSCRKPIPSRRSLSDRNGRRASPIHITGGNPRSELAGGCGTGSAESADPRVGPTRNNFPRGGTASSRRTRGFSWLRPAEVPRMCQAQWAAPPNSAEHPAGRGHHVHGEFSQCLGGPRTWAHSNRHPDRRARVAFDPCHLAGHQPPPTHLRALRRFGRSRR